MKFNFEEKGGSRIHIFKGKNKFSEIQLCGKRGVNREKGVQTSSAYGLKTVLYAICIFKVSSPTFCILNSSILLNSCLYILNFAILTEYLTIFFYHVYLQDIVLYPEENPFHQHRPKKKKVH